MAELDQVLLALLQLELLRFGLAGLGAELAVELVQPRVLCPQRSFPADR
jgi:hypothetical protein